MAKTAASRREAVSSKKLKVTPAAPPSCTDDAELLSPRNVDADGAALERAAGPRLSDITQVAAERDAQLRAFDHELKYGPSVGVTRLERWQRAKMYGLEPPPSIPELLQGAPDPSQHSVYERLMR